MNFEPVSVLRTKIKEEDDISNIIDLDLDKSPEDLVYEWNSKVRLKFKNYIVDSEQSLDILMKWYIKMMKEEAMNFEDFHTLKLFTTNHMQFFKLYFIELNCCFMDNYLDNMEEILSFYVNLEVKTLPAKQKDDNKRAYKKVWRKIISILSLYLLNREDRISHVIMKVKLNLQTEGSRDLLNLLYGNFLTKRPKDKSDLEFCRAYILYQKWKTIRKPDEWEKMDEVMYNLYERTPESIKSNPVLKQILLPQNSSTLNTLIHLSEKHLIISEEYFKYIKSNKIQDDDISSAISDIEIQDDDFIPDMIGDAEDQELEKAHKNFIKSMSSTYLEDDKSDECMDIKVESGSDDEECQIVGVSSLGDDPKGTDVVHEILDDDDDEDDGIIEIIYFAKKDEKQSISQEDKGEGSTLSFLESITIPECRDVSIETVSSSTNNTCVPLPAKVNNSGETSSKNAEVEVADSPTSKSLQRELSKEISKTNVVTSIAQTASVSETASLISELCKTVTHVENDSNHPSHIENSISVEATCDLTESNRIPSKKKNVVSIETQTDESELEKSTEQNGICRSYYYYGLDTPPSDQPEHIPPVTESTYPVYANIVRTHSPDETDSLAKATETDSLSSSVDDNDIDNNSKSSPTGSVDLTPTSVVQNESNDLNECSLQGITQYHPSLLDATFIQNIHKSLNKTSDLNGLCSNQRGDVSGMCSNSEECIDFHNRTKHASNDFQLNDTTREGHSLSVGECQSTPQEQTVDVRDISSLDLNTNTYHRTTDTYSSSQTNLRSPSPFRYRDDNIPCTSPDFIITSAESSNILFSDRSKPADISNASPDVTSTSADVQDFNETQCNGELNADDEDQLIYHHLNADVPEIEEHAVNNETYCSEEEEIYIEGPILMSNGDELTYIVHEALSVGANVNICMEETPVNNLVPDSVSSIDQHKDTGQVKESEEKHNQSTYPLKELKISVEKIDLSPNNRNNRSSPKKIMFTSSEKIVKPSPDDSLKLGKKVHTKWNELKETHNLDEIFCGPVSKINETNGSINPAPNFDLFSSNPSTICETSESRISENPPAHSNQVTTVANGVMKDDFRTYYEQSKNISVDDCTSESENHIKEKNDIISSTINPVRNGVCRPTDNGKVTGLLIPKALKSLQDAGQSSSSGDSPISSVPTNSPDGGRVRSKNVKRVHIAETIMDSRHSVPQFTTENTDNVLRGILKKSLSERQRSKRGTFSWRIPIHKMNLRSLKQYNVEPDNIRIQSVPCVTVERLSDNEIAQWLRVSEISRKIRLEKQQLQYASSKSIKVDYNKRTSHINENDIVQYNNNGRIVKMSLPETFGQWRSNSVPQTKSNRLDEGLQELPYTEKKTGKRKRQNNVSVHNTQTPRRGPVFRKTSDKNLESVGVSKTTRKRKKSEDCEALTNNGY